MHTKIYINNEYSKMTSGIKIPPFSILQIFSTLEIFQNFKIQNNLPTHTFRKDLVVWLLFGF